jgi:hypothetical protein
MFGKNIAAADIALEPPEGFVFNRADIRQVASVPHEKFAAGGSSVGNIAAMRSATNQMQSDARYGSPAMLLRSATMPVVFGAGSICLQDRHYV